MKTGGTRLRCFVILRRSRDERACLYSTVSNGEINRAHGKRRVAPTCDASRGSRDVGAVAGFDADSPALDWEEIELEPLAAAVA